MKTKGKELSEKEQWMRSIVCKGTIKIEASYVTMEDLQGLVNAVQSEIWGYLEKILLSNVNKKEKSVIEVVPNNDWGHAPEFWISGKHIAANFDLEKAVAEIAERLNIRKPRIC